MVETIAETTVMKMTVQIVQVGSNKCNSILRKVGIFITFPIFCLLCNRIVFQRYIPLYAAPRTPPYTGPDRPRFEFRALTTRVIQLFENYDFES